MRKKFFLLIIVCLVMGAGVMAQTSTVSGTVFAEDNNEPIIGASVLGERYNTGGSDRYRR